MSLRSITIAVLALAVTAQAQTPEAAEEAAREAAREVLEQVRTAYQEAPALSDTIYVSIGMPGRQAPQMSRGSLRIAGSDFEYQAIGMSLTLTCADDELTFEMKPLAGKAVQVERGEDALASAREALGELAQVLPAQLLLRFGEDWDAALLALSLYIVEGAELVSHETLGEFHEVLFERPDGRGKTVLRVDAKSMLIVQARTEAQAPGRGEDALIVADLSFAPVVHETLPEPIRVAPDLELVESMPELFNLARNAERQAPPGG